MSVHMFAQPALSELSLDAAIQLDLLARNKAADRSTISRLLGCLAGPNEPSSGSVSMNLHESPIGVEVVSSTFSGFTQAGGREEIINVKQLENALGDIMTRLHRVSTSVDDDNVAQLRDFCLSLHNVMINVDSPFEFRDDWQVRNGYES